MLHFQRTSKTDLHGLPMWFCGCLPLSKPSSYRWYVATKDNSLSFFYFWLRADYIVLRLCGAQCNWSGRFIRYIQYLVSFQCLQGLLPWNQVYVFSSPWAILSPSNIKKRRWSNPTANPAQAISRRGALGKRSGGEPVHRTYQVESILNMVGLKITSQRQMILDPIKDVATKFIEPQAAQPQYES